MCLQFTIFYIKNFLIPRILEIKKNSWPLSNPPQIVLLLELKWNFLILKIKSFIMPRIKKTPIFISKIFLIPRILEIKKFLTLLPTHPSKKIETLFSRRREGIKSVIKKNREYYYYPVCLLSILILAINFEPCEIETSCLTCILSQWSPFKCYQGQWTWPFVLNLRLCCRCMIFTNTSFLILIFHYFTSIILFLVTLV